MSDDPIRWLWAALTVVVWLVFTGWTIWRFRSRPTATAQPGSTRCEQSPNLHSPRCGRNSGKHLSSSPAARCHMPTSRKPGESTT